MTIVATAVPSIAAVRLACLVEIHARLVAPAPPQQLRLLATHSAWQPDSAWTRKRRLWVSFRTAGLALPQHTEEEVSRNGPDGLQFFGAATIRPDELAIADTILRAQPVSFLVIAPGSTPSIQELLSAGWDRHHPTDFEIWRDLAITVTRHDGILLRPFGSFDDPEAGFNLILSPERASHVQQALQGADPQ